MSTMCRYPTLMLTILLVSWLVGCTARTSDRSSPVEPEASSSTETDVDYAIMRLVELYPPQAWKEFIPAIQALEESEDHDGLGIRPRHILRAPGAAKDWLSSAFNKHLIEKPLFVTKSKPGSRRP